MHFVYVDCNASLGRYDGELEEIEAGKRRTLVFGSPIIGIQVLDSLVVMARKYGINLRTSAILVEENNRRFQELQRTLQMANLADRVKQTGRFSELRNREIAVIRGDSTALAQDLIEYTQSKNTFALYFLDPWGPKGIPLRFVNEVISKPKHDVVINMPYQDLLKKTGMATKEALTSMEAALVKYHDEMFGNTDWQKTVTQSQSLEIDLRDCYKESLQSVDASLAVKSIALHFPDKKRIMFYLYLTTHDPSGALAMNKILRDAGLQEQELRWRLREAKKTQRGLQKPLFDASVSEPKLEEDSLRAAPEEIAEHITSLFTGQTVTLKDIYRSFADESYFDTEIKSALGLLKKKSQATYQGTLTISTPIHIK